MGTDLTQKEASSTTRIVGRNEVYDAEIELGIDGKHRLLVDAQTSPVPLGQLFVENVLNGTSPSLAINGSAGVEFILPQIAVDRIVSRISIYGRDNGIQYGKFLGLNSAITNGITVEIKSEDQIFTFKPIQTTDDFRNKFCIVPSDFILNKESGDDAFTATFEPRAPFYIRGVGTFTTDDYIKIIINDNLNSVNYLEGLVTGAIQ